MTRITEQLEKAVQDLMSWIAISLAGGFLWAVRQILTHRKQIELIEAEVRHRDQQRKEDREMMRDIGRKVDALYERGSK